MQKASLKAPLSVTLCKFIFLNVLHKNEKIKIDIFDTLKLHLYTGHRNHSKPTLNPSHEEK